MQLEIVDYENKKSYIGDHGTTLVTSDLLMISLLKTEKEGYVVERTNFYIPNFIQANIATEEEAKTIALSLLADDDKHLAENIVFDGIRMFKAEMKKEQANMLLNKLFKSDISSKADIDFTPLHNALSHKCRFGTNTMPLYTKLDTELTQKAYEALEK
jgi:hypothetical protein